MNKCATSVLRATCIAAALILSACASTSRGVQTSAPDSVSAENAAGQQQVGMARLIVSRDYAAPVLMKATIDINGQRLGALRNSQYLEVYVPPGDYKLSASFFAARGTTLNFRVAANESYGLELDSPVVPSAVLLPNFKQYAPDAQPEKYNALTKVDSKPYAAAQ